MKMTLYILALFVALGLSENLQAQNEYSTAVGLRLGSPLSASFKAFINDSGSAVEVFGGVRGYSGYSWFNIGGAYEVHKPFSSDIDGLMWYVGGGGSVFFWTYKDFYYGDRSSSTTFGILGTLGLDYKFENIPVNVSADWMPIYFINGYFSGFGGGYGALSVRYTLGE